jgi:UDP-N-acetyl-D-galactosamine dehydrogenase
MNNKKIAVIGLGYVGLPLSIEFSKKREVIGFDINKSRIDELKKGIDVTAELSKHELKEGTYISYTTNLDDLKECTIFIITVPTPIDKHKKPDLTSLKKSSHSIGKIIKKDDIIIYESTVYPGATEEVCVPILEQQSGLIFNKDFYCGYSPERINPGDKKHRITNIKKVTSGSTPEIATEVDELY